MAKDQEMATPLRRVSARTCARPALCGYGPQSTGATPAAHRNAHTSAAVRAHPLLPRRAAVRLVPARRDLPRWCTQHCRLSVRASVHGWTMQWKGFVLAKRTARQCFPRLKLYQSLARFSTGCCAHETSLNKC